MNILGCLDQPTWGTYVLGGKDVSRMDDDELAMARNGLVGFLPQSFQLATPHYGTGQRHVAPWSMPGRPAGNGAGEPQRCSRPWGSRIAYTIRPMSYPAANSSALRLRALRELTQYHPGR